MQTILEIQNLKEETQIIIGKNVRNLRLKKGWSKQDLADRLKVKTRNILHIETGRSAHSLIMFLQLAQVFGIKTQELVVKINDTGEH